MSVITDRERESGDLLTVIYTSQKIKLKFFQMLIISL